MSGANLFGAVSNTFIFAVVWIFLGWVVDSLSNVFGYATALLPSIQDAVNGFNTVTLIYGYALPAIAFLVIWINYYLNEQYESTGEGI